jgi:hypothetical protein
MNRNILRRVVTARRSKLGAAVLAVTAGLAATLGYVLPMSSSSAGVAGLPTSCATQVSQYDDYNNPGIWGTFTLCASVSGGNLNLDLEAVGVEHKYQGTWRNDDDGYTKRLNGNVSIQRDGRTVDTGTISGTSDWSTRVAATKTFTEGPPGTYTIYVQPTLQSDYWGTTINDVAPMKVKVNVVTGQ